jgi:hypothetical protein
VKSRLPRKPQPVPPIYEPEVAARAIVAAARDARREYWVGFSSVEAILSAKLAPSVGDRYLGRNGFQAQQTDEPVEPDRPDNLWRPVDDDRDHGAHGSFDARARSFSLEQWMSERRGWLAAGAAGLLCGAVLMKARLGGRA